MDEDKRGSGRWFEPVEKEILSSFSFLKNSGKYSKYSSASRFFPQNRSIVRLSGLCPEALNSVALDIGCGAGFLLKYWQAAGARAVGVDLSDRGDELREMSDALGVEVLDGSVSFEGELDFVGALNALGLNDFDVVTAISTMFDRGAHSSEGVWGPKKWAHFLDRVVDLLRPGGSLILKPNRHIVIESKWRDSNFYDYRIGQVFEQTCFRKINRIFAFNEAGVRSAIRELENLANK